MAEIHHQKSFISHSLDSILHHLISGFGRNIFLGLVFASVVLLESRVFDKLLEEIPMITRMIYNALSLQLLYLFLFDDLCPHLAYIKSIYHGTYSSQIGGLFLSASHDLLPEHLYKNVSINTTTVTLQTLFDLLSESFASYKLCHLITPDFLWCCLVL